LAEGFERGAEDWDSAFDVTEKSKIGDPSMELAIGVSMENGEETSEEKPSMGKTNRSSEDCKDWNSVTTGNTLAILVQGENAVKGLRNVISKSTTTF
jgi:hypothetical protein